MWRPRKQGRRLGIAIEAMRPLSAAVLAAIEEEAAALAPHRGASTAAVTIA